MKQKQNIYMADLSTALLIFYVTYDIMNHVNPVFHCLHEFNYD